MNQCYECGAEYKECRDCIFWKPLNNGSGCGKCIHPRFDKVPNPILPYTRWCEQGKLKDGSDG